MPQTKIVNCPHVECGKPNKVLVGDDYRAGQYKHEDAIPRFTWTCEYCARPFSYRNDQSDVAWKRNG